MPSMGVFKRFGGWVQAVGGPTRAAELLGCDAGHVVHIARGRRRPGIGLALEIERRTRRLPGGAIKPAAWVGVEVDRRTRAERTSPEAA